MSKKKRREPKIECIAYISVEGDLNKIDRLEAKQERYIREYANAHNIANINKIIPGDNLVDAYAKVGIIKAAGGIFISVENGNLDLGISIEGE